MGGALLGRVSQAFNRAIDRRIGMIANGSHANCFALRQHSHMTNDRTGFAARLHGTNHHASASSVSRSCGLDESGKDAVLGVRADLRVDGLVSGNFNVHR